MAYLLHACVTTPAGEPLADLPAPAQAQVAEALARLDPQADLLIDLTCPNCGAALQVPFDPAAYLFDELAARAEVLYREVHLLALNYHWSEREILAMPRGKRQMYLGMLSEHSAPAGGAV